MSPANGRPINSSATLTASRSSWRWASPNRICRGLSRSSFSTSIRWRKSNRWKSFATILMTSSARTASRSSNRASVFCRTDKANLHKEAQRAYLANISYVDYCLGVLFEALEKSKYADNTIIMLWGDHGWHLSEKLKYGKTDLWEESDRVPFIVRVPGLTPPGFKCEGVVNLLDMYPTLVELCGLPPNAENEGRSFAPLLKNPKMEWNHPTLTTYQFKNHSLTDGRYRYTWYGGKADGAEELYDHSTDPLEHKNLAANPESKEIIARFKKYLPTHDEPDSPRNGSADGDKKAMRKAGKANDDE